MLASAALISASVDAVASTDGTKVGAGVGGNETCKGLGARVGAGENVGADVNVGEGVGGLKTVKFPDVGRHKASAPPPMRRPAAP